MSIYEIKYLKNDMTSTYGYDFCGGNILIPGRNYSGTDYNDKPVNPFWTVIDATLMIIVICGNTLTVIALRSNKSLSRIVANKFILSLAVSDLFLGLTLPFHMTFYLCNGLGHNKATCIMRFVLMVLACSASVYNLISIAVDRYIAIVHPLHYCRYMTSRNVVIIIMSGWFNAIIMSTVPIYWNTWEQAVICELDEVLQPNYVVFIILPAFVLVWITMFMVYWRIWREADGQCKRMRNSLSDGEEGPSNRKSVQVVLLVLGCFSICWLPFFVVATLRSLNLLRTEESILIYKAAFSLAMANSGMNPIIYVWKNSEFKRTFALILRCHSLNSNHQVFSARNNVKNRISIISRIQLIKIVKRSEPETTELPFNQTHV